MESVAELERQYRDCVTSMKEEGLLDFTFEQFYEGQQDDLREISRCIDTFFDNMEKTIPKMGSYIKREMINYHKMQILVFKIKGGCSFIGVCKVIAACDELQEAINMNDNDRGRSALLRMKHEYDSLKPGFKRLIKLASKIHSAADSVSASSASNSWTSMDEM